MTKSLNTQAIIWMLINAFFFSVMTSLVRYIGDEVNVYVMVFFRNLLALPVVFIWLLPYINKSSVFSFEHLKRNFLRSFISVFSMSLWFYSLTIMPLNEAVALSFVTPLFTSLAAILFFKEKVGLHRWAALIAGFLGILIILRPVPGYFNHASLYVLLTTILWSISFILVKQLTKTEHPSVIVFYFTLLMTLFTFPMAVLNWQDVGLSEIAILFFIGLTATLSQIAVSYALKKADMTVILPIDFSRLVFVSIIAYFTFEESPDIWSFLGGGIIIAAVAYVAKREALKGKKHRGTRYFGK